MTEFKLESSNREATPKEARRNGLIPAIVYGKGLDNSPITLNKVDFMRLFKEAGSSNLVELKLPDGKAVKTLIQDTQYDAVTSEILHVDFYKVNMKEKIHAEIPLTFVGDSAAVIDKEGSLITPKDSIEVECLPGDLISELKVDISVLDDFDKDIRVSDLNIPEGIEVIDDPETIIAHVEEPRSEEEMAGLETEVVADVSTIEVENKGEETPAEGEGAEKTAEKSK